MIMCVFYTILIFFSFLKLLLTMHAFLNRFLKKLAYPRNEKRYLGFGYVVHPYWCDMKCLYVVYGHNSKVEYLMLK